MAEANRLYHRTCSASIEVSEVTLPAYYASAFVNGDFSGIETDDERQHVQGILDSLASDGWAIVDVKRDEEGNGEEPRFTWLFQMYNGYPSEAHVAVTCWITSCTSGANNDQVRDGTNARRGAEVSERGGRTTPEGAGSQAQRALLQRHHREGERISALA